MRVRVWREARSFFASFGSSTVTMDDVFASKLSQGPLSGILNQYSSNKLLSKSRITKSERDEYEEEELQKKESEIMERKNKKRKKMQNEEKERYLEENHDRKRRKISTSKIKVIVNDNNNNDDKNELEIDKKNKEIDDKMSHLTEEEVIKRLRELKEPIRYFGELDKERLKRLRRLEILEHERKEGASKGLKNARELIKNEVEKELEAAMAAQGIIDKDDLNTNNLNDTNDVNNINMNINRKELKNKRKKKYDIIRSRSSFSNSEDYVLFFFKRLLSEWEQNLLNRSQNQKSSASGKNATMLQKQARRDIRPLFKQLKNRTVPADVLNKSEKMVFAAEKRNYVEAKRIFFEMAIGNAPWPMGVTMVGIHERSGRSKIFSSQIAHVMNDEIQRKYIHAMARLISFAQSKYPSNDLTQNMG